MNIKSIQHNHAIYHFWLENSTQLWLDFTITKDSLIGLLSNSLHVSPDNSIHQQFMLDLIHYMDFHNFTELGEIEANHWLEHDPNINLIDFPQPFIDILFIEYNPLEMTVYYIDAQKPFPKMETVTFTRSHGDAHLLHGENISNTELLILAGLHLLEGKSLNWYDIKYNSDKVSDLNEAIKSIKG